MPGQAKPGPLCEIQAQSFALEPGQRKSIGASLDSANLHREGRQTPQRVVVPIFRHRGESQ